MDIALFSVMVVSVYLAGQIAEHRGRSFKNWAGLAVIIGPLALPLVFLFPCIPCKDDRA